jgi:hypothetical protein
VLNFFDFVCFLFIFVLIWFDGLLFAMDSSNNMYIFFQVQSASEEVEQSGGTGKRPLRKKHEDSLWRT